MSKSIYLVSTNKQAPWRQAGSVFVLTLDTNQRFIDVLYTPVTTTQTNSLLYYGVPERERYSGDIIIAD